MLSANADNLSVARNAMTGYAAWAVNLGTGLVVTPILLRSLGGEGFGVWTLAITIASYVAIVEAGLGVATVRNLASSLAIGDTKRASTVAASARATYLAMAGAGTIVLAALAMLPGHLVGTGGISSGRVQLTVVALGVGNLVSLATTTYPAIAIGAGRADLGTRVGMVASIAMAIGQVVVVLIFKDLVALAVVTALGVAAGTLAVRMVVRHHFREVDVGLENLDWRVVRELMASGWRNAAIGIGVAAAIQSDVLVVGAFLGPTSVAAYGVAVRASTMMQTLATRGTDVLVPTFAHATTVQDARRTVTAFRESAFLTRAILVPILIVLVAFGESILRLWLGEVPSRTDIVLVLLVVGAIVAAPGYSSLALLTGMNRLRYLLLGASIAAIANLGLSILLTWRFGLLGPVLGSLVAFVIWEMIVLPRHVGSVLNVPWIPLSAVGLGSLGVAALSASVAAWVTREGLGWTSPHQGLAGAAIVGTVYLASLWFTLSTPRRERYRDLLISVARQGSRKV